ncbi:MAG: hypothetical protein KAV83_13290 [Desulfobacterales bacterium]|nr:hypothetical protein [Desulfobacterales bacterium]
MTIIIGPPPLLRFWILDSKTKKAGDRVYGLPPALNFYGLFFLRTSFFQAMGKPFQDTNNNSSKKICRSARGFSFGYSFPPLLLKLNATFYSWCQEKNKEQKTLVKATEM